MYYTIYKSVMAGRTLRELGTNNVKNVDIFEQESYRDKSKCVLSHSL